MERPQQGRGSSVLAMCPHCFFLCLVGCVMWSATVNLFEVVTLIAVALFLLVGVVVTALRPTPLLGLFLGRLRPPSCLSALASGMAIWTEICATWGHITAATTPALSLVLCLRLL